MIDFHTHILPGIDDGSRDITMTERMLEMEKDQGVTHVYATPHFYAHRRSVQQFVERREGALSKTRELLAAREDLPEITAGAEVYYFRGIGRAEQTEKLCIEGTDILLLEMPFEQWHSEQSKDVYDLIRRRHLRIVLAHVERYRAFQKDTATWDEILEMPVTIQMNAESFINEGTFLHRNRNHKFCIQMLQNFDNCIIGSDCHNITSRLPNVAEARIMIEKKCGSTRLAQLDKYTDELLGVQL